MLQYTRCMQMLQYMVVVVAVAVAEAVAVAVAVTVAMTVAVVMAVVVEVAIIIIITSLTSYNLSPFRLLPSSLRYYIKYFFIITIIHQSANYFLPYASRFSLSFLF